MQMEGTDRMPCRPAWIGAIAETYVLRYDTDVSKRTSFMATVLTASQARVALYRLIDEAADSHRPVQITGKRNNAVLLSEGDWRAIQETLYLLSVPGMRES